MLFIKNGYLLDPACGREGPADLLVEGDRIRKIAPPGELSPKEEEGEPLRIIDAKGMLVAPGLVDVHVHFRDPGFPWKEDILTGAAAAARGGFTTVVLMANTKPPVDNERVLKEILEKGRGTGIHIMSCANVTMGMKGEELTDMEALAEAGAAGFTDDGIPLLNEELVREAMLRAAALMKPLSFHEENPAYIVNNGINAGAAAERFGLGGSHREAEISLVKRDLQLAEETGAEISIQHISAREAVELVRQAKKKNPRIHAEATPHHFTLTEEAVLKHGSLAKMNPPLREEADRLAIIKGLRDGTIDMIATDHAPHSREEKNKPLTEAPSGIIGLETALSLGLRELVQKGGLTMRQLFERMSFAPAKLYRMDAGYIAEGGPADLVILAPEETWTVKEFLSRSCNSPFIGETLPGVVHYTVCAGKVVYEAGGKEKEEDTRAQAGER